MRTRTITTSIALSNRMLQTLFSLHLQQYKPYIKQVCSLFSLFPIKHHFFTTSSTHQTNNTHQHISSINLLGIAKSVIFRCSHLWDKKGETFGKPSLKDLLLKLSNISPKTTRPFWRFSELNPADVLKILLGFEFDNGKFEFEAKKIGSLLGIFKWASEQSRDFKHLPQSCKVMASMLVRVGLFRDAELLVSKIESGGILLDCHEIFSNLIEGYVGAGEFERATLIYDRMRGLGLVPSLPCYNVLLNNLVQRSETQLASQVYLDMAEMGLGVSIEEKGIYENVIQLLCRDGKVQEARNIVKKVIAFGMEPSNVVLNAIASGYCEKRDYDDLLSFFAEMKCAPNVVVGNKIIFSVCKNFGVQRANFFTQELEHLGNCPDEITFGILIGWSCREGKMKNAFIYLSEVLSRCLQPHIHSYNALISGVFKDGMWKHARDILHEMDDRGITPDMLTFKVLLAGYCKARQFDEVKLMVCEMVDRGLIQFSSLEDPLSKAFMVLGLNPLAVKVRRDNDAGFSKTEFFDNLGNGLYLDTDLDDYEKTMTRILDDSMILDYNSLVLKECGHRNYKTAVTMVDEMVYWGQELSLPAFSTLVKGLLASRCSIKEVTGLLEKEPKLTNQLDQEILNLLVQAYSKRGVTYKARMVFDGMLQRCLQIENETYTALITILCKKGNLRCLHHCWGLARQDKWLPKLKDCKVLMGCLCQREMLKEALELLESTVVTYPHEAVDTCHAFVGILCGTGFTGTAHVLAEELLKRGHVLDHTAYSHLVRGFCKEKRFSEAFMISDIMLAKTLVPHLDVSLLLIPHLCRAGNFEKAVSLKEIGLREQPSVSLSVHCALMSGFCRIGMVGEAANLLQDMLLKGLLPDIEVYNILVQGYCRAKDYWKVGELLGVMIRKNISITISSYRKLVSLMCLEGRIPFALSVKELMLKESNPSYLIVYNILIFYLFLSGNSLLVEILLDELEERGLQLDAVTYNFVVHGFSQCKDASRSFQYLNTMISKELRPSNRCLRAVISCLCYDGDLVKPLKLSRDMESRGWLHGSVVQNNIVEGLLNHGKLQEAVNFLDRMEEKSLIPDNINYDNLIKRLCYCGRQDKAIDLLDIMLKKGNIPNSTSYDSVIQGFCTCHKLDEALDFHTEMLGRNLKPSINTWSILTRNFCEHGKTAEAEILLNSVVQIGEIPSREMYCSLIDRYRFENNFNKALEIIQAMQLNGYEPDFETHWSLISNLSESNDKDNSNNFSRRFLSRLLSENGFAREDPKAKLG